MTHRWRAPQIWVAGAARDVGSFFADAEGSLDLGSLRVAAGSRP
jgi:hypothetical protein